MSKIRQPFKDGEILYAKDINDLLKGIQANSQQLNKISLLELDMYDDGKGNITLTFNSKGVDE